MKPIFILLLIMPFFANAQIVYPYGHALESTTFTFSNADSLTHHLTGLFGEGGVADFPVVQLDTSGSKFWEIGRTLKPVFSNDTIAENGIMTDTLTSYPPNTNASFILKINYLVPNVIIDFWHHYQTDSLHAGGIVEFSFDTGATWMNVADCPEINRVNFYTGLDTIISGQPAFTGTSAGLQLSRLQFMNCMIIGAKSSATSCTDGGAFQSFSPIYLRFRFVSDSTVDSLSGWMIDSIKIENPGCIIDPGYVPEINNLPVTNVYPNPSTGIITVSSTAIIKSVTITNLLGQVLLTRDYNTKEAEINVASLPPGMYLIKINRTEVRKFVKE